MNDIVFKSSTEAEDAFYTAFSSGDLNAMRGIWLDADYTSCVHPMGNRLSGTTAILKSWETILKNTTDIMIEISDLGIHSLQQLAVHTLTENIHSLDTPEQIHRFLATNIYKQTADGWKLILHHASPIPRDLSQEKSSERIVH